MHHYTVVLRNSIVKRYVTILAPSMDDKRLKMVIPCVSDTYNYHLTV